MRSCKEPLRGRGALWWSASSFRPLCGGSHSRKIELLSSRGSRHGYVTDCRSRLTTSFKCMVGITPASASKLGLQEYAKRLCLDVSSLPSIVRSGQAACVKSFGCRQAPESPRRTNPRTTGWGLWVFPDLASLRAAQMVRLDGSAKVEQVNVAAVERESAATDRAERAGDDDPCMEGREVSRRLRWCCRGLSTQSVMPGHGRSPGLVVSWLAAPGAGTPPRRSR